MVFRGGGFQKKQIFFDFDDTLIDDGYKFELTSCDCAKAIVLGFETESPPIDEIIQEFRRIDLERLKSVPPEERFLPSRFITSWHLAYDFLCEKYGKSNKRSTHMMLEGLLMQNWEPPYFVIPGAVDTLMDLLHTGKYDLRMLSAGDPVIQERKVNATDLAKHFASLHFFPDGDKHSPLVEAAKEFGAGNVWMIGNSMSTDINPALRAGVNAVYIPRGSWILWKDRPFNNRYLQLKSIADVPRVLETWEVKKS